eukprot:scaffold41978_cov250-Skeletonema_dohrnii-CCMP3373.AAC.2
MEMRSPLMPILHWHWAKTKEQQPHLSFFAGNPPMLASTGSKESAETNRERVAAPRPRPSNSNSNSNSNNTEAKGRKRRKKESFVLDSDTSDDDGMQDEYEDDGFIVFGSQEEEDSSVDIDDNDICAVCKEGGELVVCDGGFHSHHHSHRHSGDRGGCGKSFHLKCIKREEIPDGEFVLLPICQIE